MGAGADSSEEALGKFKETVNSDAFVTRDYQELLSRPDIDAVVITSPDFTHEEYT